MRVSFEPTIHPRAPQSYVLATGDANMFQTPLHTCVVDGPDGHLDVICSLRDR
jgi:hypothetical protein